MRRFAFLAMVACAALLLMGVSATARRRVNRDVRDWLQFDGPVVAGDPPVTTISSANVQQLAPLWQSTLPAVCDGTPLFVTGVLTPAGVRDLLIAETTAGQLIALDAADGSTVWQTDPPAGQRWTTSSPAVGPGRQYVYAYTLDGLIHRYAVASGAEAQGGGFPALVTTKGDVEKGSSNISIATAADGRTFLYMSVAGYPDPGDAGDYQGHLVAINLDSGEQHVFNALCSDRAIHFSESGGADDCADVQSGIWARAGAVYDRQTDRIYVTMGNGTYTAADGGFDWGTSVVALRPDGTTDGGTPLDSYTPVEYQALTDQDLDVGSTAVEPLPVVNQPDWPRLGVQSGKDSRIRLLNLSDLSSQGGPRHLGGELQIVNLPQQGEVLTQPAAWLGPDDQTWLFVSNDQGTTGFTLTADDNGNPQLVPQWTKAIPGTTPILVNDILYLCSPNHLAALQPTTGAIIWHDHSLGGIHWQTPIVVNDRLFIADTSHNITAYAIGGDVNAQ